MQEQINSQSMLKVGTILRGIYRIDSYLSSGGFGNTYIATNIEFDERVAIKEFFMKGITERDKATCAVSVSNVDNIAQFEEQREKFKKEARRLRKLKNKHIVKVHDLFEENGTAYYVMDFIDGESLAERIKRTGLVLTETKVMDILRQVLEALKEVHQNELWHLDLKPGNIMLDKNETAYLIDFGASKQVRPNGSMTTSTAMCYTPGYAPNEQMGQMTDRFGPWTDIYALGATVYNLLTNEKPPMAIDIEEDEEDAFTFPTSISDDMKRLVFWMMQPKRKKRPQSVDEVLNKLDKGIGQVTTNNRISEPNDEETIIEKNYFRNCNFPAQKGDYRAVDLGLSVLWAEFNVGANSIDSQGGLYGWGDPTGKKTSTDIADYVPIHKYLSHQIKGDMGYSDYDIATMQWGGRWRMPNRKHWEELINRCQWVKAKQGSLEGYHVCGPNGNTIFLPFTGIRFENEITNTHSGYYWASELAENDRTCAHYFYFDVEMRNDNVNTRNFVYSGRAVRAVCEK